MLKEIFGLNAGKALEAPYGAQVDCGNQPPRDCIVLSYPSTEIVPNIGEGYVVIYEQQPSGAWATMQVHISRIIAG